jgi:ribosomal protein S18 acetylase RimI-like enzyme
MKDTILGSKFPKSFYLQFLYDSNATCVVAETPDGTIIGCGTAKIIRRDGLSVNERTGHVLTLAVDPAWRRKGIGRDLLEALVLQIKTICAGLSLQIGQRVTLKSIILQTSSRNTAALKFYEVCGYQRQGLKMGYYGGVPYLWQSALIEDQRCYPYETFAAGKRRRESTNECTDEQGVIRKSLGCCILGSVVGCFIR